MRIDKCKSLSLIKDIKHPITGYEFLEKLIAEAVNGADVEIADVRLMADQLPDLAADAEFELLSGPFSKSKGYDILRFGKPFGNQVCDPQRNKFRLAGAGASDDLQMLSCQTWFGFQ